MNFDYESTYLNLYKKLPMINAISAYVLVIAWAIVDWAEWIVFGEFLGFLIWLGIGAPFAALVGLITVVFISPIVVQTDTLMQMKGKANSTTTISNEVSTQVQPREINQTKAEELTNNQQAVSKQSKDIDQTESESSVFTRSKEDLEKLYRDHI